jgi:hypothetical protein
MKPAFKVTRLPLETLIDALIRIYKNGYDYVDFSADNNSPIQDKLIIQTDDTYINKDFEKERKDFEKTLENPEDYEDDETDPYLLPPPTVEIKRLTDDDINGLL